jgi:hypothetical protein
MHKNLPKLVSISAFLVFFLYSHVSSGVLSWIDGDEFSKDKDQKLVAYLGAELDKKSDINYPNIATASIEVTYKDSTDPAFAEIPHFFLSGWERTAYRSKIHREIDDYIKDCTEEFIKKSDKDMYFIRYRNYSVRMLEDFFPIKDDYKGFIGQTTGITFEPGDEWEHTYLHSEEGIFQYTRRNLGKLLDHIGRGKDILSLIVKINSFHPACSSCQQMGSSQSFQELLQSEIGVSVPIGFDILTLPPPLLPTPKRKLEEGKQDTTQCIQAPKTHKIESDPSEDVLRTLKFGQKNTHFVELILPKDRSWEPIKKMLLEGQDPSEIAKKINLIKVKSVEAPVKWLCDLLNAYVNICIKGDGDKETRSRITQNMQKVIKEINDYYQSSLRLAKFLKPTAAVSETKNSYSKYEIIALKILEMVQ